METKLNINAIPDGSIGKDKFTEEVKNLINNYPEINHGTSDTTFTLTPNTFHVWDKVTSLDLSFEEEIEGIANEFLFQFTSGTTATTLILPDTIKWANEEVPTIEPNKIYQISILKGLASCLIFPPYFNSKLNYFSIISLKDNSTISLPTNTSPNLMYSLNETTWKRWNYSTIKLNSGDILYLKGDNSNGFSTSNSKYNNFSITGKVELSGNIMSLLYEDDFENNNTLPETYTFCRLFYSCTGIVSAKNLILPAIILSSYCYNYMFLGCTSLTEAPQLPATTLASSCYGNMFQGCTSLTIAPQLLATTLVNHCYQYMFQDCTSLTTAPQLLATTLASYCYYGMFQGCTSLTIAPQLPATTLANNFCYGSMFQNCTSLTEAPQLPATTLASSCYGNMFQGCTSLTIAPQLPATTLANDCYQSMFSGCTSLTEVPELPATTLASYCYNQMFYNCTSLTTAPQLPATTLKNYCYISMFSGCTSLAIAPQLPATTLGDHCYYKMFKGCTSLIEAPELPATTLASYCYDSMFSGCTSLTEAPELPVTTLADNCYQFMFSDCRSLTTAPILPATTLASYCYKGMFQDCSKLNYIKMLATDISASNCLDNWVYGVASSGTFVKNPAMTTLPSGISGIPEGWTVEDNGGYGGQ